MNIRILDSQLREYLETKASAREIAEKLSLTSLSVEKIEKLADDYVYGMEITTNRPDLFSVMGVAREAAAVLPHSGIEAKFNNPEFKKPEDIKEEFPIIVKNDPKLVNRICAVVMDVKIGNPPKYIKDSLEAGGIRSLNNVIDVTNYVMRTIGHPAHVFDFDRLNTKELIIREALKGERILTLDEKEHTLVGGEIVAVDDNNRIVDLLGIMGLENSVVNEKTKRILYFLDNNEPYHIRTASMNLGIRTEAAVLNEKGVDPELAMDALLYGIEIFQKTCDGKVASAILDLYPNKPKEKVIDVDSAKIDKVIGVEIDPKTSVKALSDLGFKIKLNGNLLKVQVPSFRLGDVEIEEDIIEEIARVYGYQNLPSLLPSESSIKPHGFTDEFYWEDRTKNALKYWGFTETYTYSFVSEEMYEGPIEDSVFVTNPLTQDFVYMRNSLIPSLLKVISDNKREGDIKIFEIANTYFKKPQGLAEEILTLSGIIKKENANFFQAKGILEQLFIDLGIKNAVFKKSKKGTTGASVYIENDYLGEVEVLDTDIIDFELNFKIIIGHASLRKEFKSFAKYPPIVEDISVVAENNISTQDLISEIKAQSDKITEASLKDTFEDTRTFHIIYQDFTKNLTKEDVTKVREKIISSLKTSFNATVK